MSKKLLSLFCVTLSMHTCYALTVDSLNCSSKQIYSKNLAIYFNKTKPSTTPIYLIKNTSTLTMMLDRATPSHGAGAGWATTIEPGKWSAIAISQPHFGLKCSAFSKGKAYLTSCSELKVCELPMDKSFVKDGNFWVAENKTWDDLVATLIKRGMPN